MPIEIAVVTIINLLAMGVSVGIFISKVNLILYRIQVLEDKQDKCNQLKERLVTLETIIKGVPQRLADVEMIVKDIPNRRVKEVRQWKD